MQPRAVTSRFDGVDTLRGWSIIAVVLLHTAIRMNGAGFSLRPAMPPWLFHLLFRNGNNGVTVFFAISGFLITLTSLRRFGSLGRMRPVIFYRIRFARIAPLLLLLLAGLSLLHWVHASGFYIPPQKSTLARAVVAVLTFHFNWLEAVRGYLPANWDVLWSLSVEEMFYIFFPFLCWALLRVPWGWPVFMAILFAFVAAGPFARTVWTTNEIWREKSYLGGMDGIALGCLCALLTDAFLARKRHRIRAAWLTGLVVAGSGLILLIAIWPHWRLVTFIGSSGLDGTLLALGTCLIIFATVLEAKSGSRWTAPIRWFGRNSYEVYLTHEFVVVWGTMFYAKYRVGPLPLWFVAILLLSGPLGALVARYISEPLNKLLRQQFADPLLKSGTIDNTAMRHRDVTRAVD